MAGGIRDFISTKPRATLLHKADLGQQGQGCDQVSFSPSSWPRAVGGGSRWTQCLKLPEQGGVVLPPSGLQTSRGLAAAWGPLPWPATVAQETAANIWISPSSTSWSHWSQHLGLLTLNIWVSLSPICRFPCLQHLHLPILNIWVFLPSMC